MNNYQQNEDECNTIFDNLFPYLFIASFLFGLIFMRTKKLNLTSFNDVDSALADIIAYNAADSIDNVVGQVLSAGTNVIYSNGPTGTTPTSSATVLPVDTMTVTDIRNAVVSLRTNKALPRMGELYAPETV